MVIQKISVKASVMSTRMVSTSCPSFLELKVKQSGSLSERCKKVISKYSNASCPFPTITWTYGRLDGTKMWLNIDKMLKI